MKGDRRVEQMVHQSADWKEPFEVAEWALQRAVSLE